MAKGNIRWYSTIRMKVVIVVIISCTLVLGGLSAFNTVKEQAQLSADLQKLAEVTSQRLSKHLIGPMWDLDRDLVEYKARQDGDSQAVARDEIIDYIQGKLA